MKHKNAMIVGSIGVLLIIIGTISYFVLSVSEEKKIEEERSDTVIKEYELFRKNVEKFSTEREQVFEKVINDLFIDSVNEDYVLWKQELASYEKMIQEVEDSSKQLKRLCVGHYYNKKEVNNKCEAFIISYETSINYYVKDILEYNQFLLKYQADTTSEEKKIEVKEFELKGYNYTDINDDGKYSGKES